MKVTLLVITVVTALAAAPLDSGWVSYYNGVDGWFSFQGPMRAMRIDPADFGMETPLEVESLKTWWYDGMGSFGDSTFGFRLYADDGSTMLWESETLHAPRGNQWTRYGLATPVTIDSGSFYIATWHREFSPWAHPYTNVDTGPTRCSYFGSPGAWIADDVGEYSYFAFVTEVQSAVSEGRWTGLPDRFGPTLVNRVIRLPDGARAQLVDATGRRIAGLLPGANDVRSLPPGIYFVRTDRHVAAVKVVVR
jgi:hypothetical protein